MENEETKLISPNDIEGQEGLQYTIVNHKARKALGLSWTCYCIIDSIYHLSNNPKSKGWCTQSNEGLAEFLGCNEKAVRRAKEKGIELGLLRYPAKRQNVNYDHRIGTTQKWYDATIINRTKCPDGKGNHPDKMSTFDSNTRTKCPHDADKMSSNKDSKDTTLNKDNNTGVVDSFATIKKAYRERSLAFTDSKIHEHVEQYGIETINGALREYDSTDPAKIKGTAEGYFIGILRNYIVPSSDQSPAEKNDEINRGFDKAEKFNTDCPEAQEFFALKSGLKDKPTITETIQDEDSSRLIELHTQCIDVAKDAAAR